MARPQLLEQFRRDPAALAAGEWWRVVTPMFFQDGHLLGTVVNLVMLALGLILSPRHAAPDTAGTRTAKRAH
ncbi:hypothetical protein EV192_104684 [Actinocrispum wychmicini]|uniref:Uncharacterized protein n=2 Tax=Actinocrispum wychmicini TaxID=1213861 RepID=A0A4R2JIW0_9PSEU|nr:hypothetical protein EV192_104684 [Actinocrispum wychmicini]